MDAIIQYAFVLNIGIMEVSPKMSPQNQLNVYFVTHKQYRLGIVKLKNAYRSFLTNSKNLLPNFKKNFHLVEFSDWLTHSLTY